MFHYSLTDIFCTAQIKLAHIKILGKLKYENNYPKNNIYNNEQISSDFELFSSWYELNQSDAQKRSITRPLRAAQGLRQLVYVFNCVLQGLYFGQRLSPLAVVRRKVVTELVQSFCQAPHAHLLPFARLHASLRRHLGLAGSLLLLLQGLLPRRRCSRFVGLEVERQVTGVLLPARAAHLRRRAHRIGGELRRGGLQQVPLLSDGSSPIGQHLDC